MLYFISDTFSEICPVVTDYLSAILIARATIRSPRLCRRRLEYYAYVTNPVVKCGMPPAESHPILITMWHFLRLHVLTETA